MTREEILSTLREANIDEKYLQMPGVMEYIYTYSERLKKDKFLESLCVEPNGDFKVLWYNFIKKENGNLEKKFSGTTTIINKYGIEIGEYSEDEWIDFFDNYSRENGRYIHHTGNNGNGSLYQYSYLDTGDYSIHRAKGQRIIGDGDSDIDSPKSQDIYNATFDTQAIISEFDKKAEETTTKYPLTAEWYAKTRKDLLDCLDKQNNPEYRYKRKIELLESKVQNLEYRNARLIKMLNRALTFVENVKASRLGQFFFKKEINRYNDDLSKDS